jgi:Prolyl oligopeptidase family
MERMWFGALVCLCGLAAATAAFAVIPDAVPNLPVLEAETAVGSIVTSAAPNVAPSPKIVDGDPSDWSGVPTRLGGTSILSHGELIYQNYLNSGWGADDGGDASRLGPEEMLDGIEPRLYRIDPFQQAYGAQLCQSPFPCGAPIGAALHYGDTTAADPLRIQANIEEARVAADAANLYAMVRTLGMDDTSPRTAMLLLISTPSDPAPYALPRAMGGITTHAEWAILASGSAILGVYHAGSPVSCAGCVAAANGSGFTNTLELAVPRALFDAGGAFTSVSVGIAVGIDDGSEGPATGLAAVAPAGAASDLIDVAFRSEPARIWMDEAQALALRAGTIDRWLAPVDLDALASGATQTFQQRPGYYEAIYVDDRSPATAYESMDNGYYQGIWGHYGMYLPQSYRPESTYGSTFWMHYRGGHANDAAAWEPGILREFGDEPGLIVVTPSARGESSWYTGRGMVDFLDAWNDAHARLRIDADRTYLSGHSMGGWASYLLGLIMPDRWAASNPEDGLLMPALCIAQTTGYSAQDGQDLNGEQMYTILENARNVPYAILHGAIDELVPVSCALSAGARLETLGYRYRNYTFLPYEHYSAPLWDDWREIVKYMTQFERDPNPPRVTFKTWPLLDHDVSTINTGPSGHSGGPDLGLHFDRAYWVSGMVTREQGIAPSNIGMIDATTWGRGVPNVIDLPEAGEGTEVGTSIQAEPHVMFGQAWLPNGADAPANKFSATLTNLSTVTLDVARMALDTGSPISGTVTTDGAASVVLAGSWTSAPTVTGAASTSWTPGSLTLIFGGAGTNSVTVTP